MKQPDKWRETIDPYTLEFKDFKLLEVLGYPYAGNDVFYVKGIYNNEEVYAFIKVARQKGADITNEVNVITKVGLKEAPVILEYKEDKFVITKEVEGERLSTILGENEKLESLGYIDVWGEKLALIHQIKGDFDDVKDRRFFHMPSIEYFRENNLEFVYDYLINNKCESDTKCFVHGDFHYANILWKDRKLVGILDFELSGVGIKEFDIAWAIIRRPSQRFMKTEEEVNRFLEGYSRVGTYNKESVKYYMCIIYSYFYTVGKESEYKEFVYNWLKNFTKTQGKSCDL